MSFIDVSYFVGDLEIPNSGNSAIAERINWFIEKYEPTFLQKLFGYPLYKAFVAGMNVAAPATPEQRLVNILYGCEYTDLQGNIEKWKGLIVTDAPVFNLLSQYVYKSPIYITVGLTPGFTAGATNATLDGTNGTGDWRGWTPIITRGSIMEPGVDYSWDPVLGIFQLLKTGDKFGTSERFFVQFQMRVSPIPSTDVTPSQSLIANYIYYQFRRSTATQYSGFGEVITSAENSNNVSPKKKIADLWYELQVWVREFCAFMEATGFEDPTIYPEWTPANQHHALKVFGFMNPIF